MTKNNSIQAKAAHERDTPEYLGSLWYSKYSLRCSINSINTGH